MWTHVGPNSRQRFVAGILVATGLLFVAVWVWHPHSLASAEASYHSGQTAVLHKDYSTAEASFTRARDLTSDPDKAAWAQYQLASCYAVQPADKQQAIQSLQQLIRDYPHHFLAARAQTDIDRLEGKKPAAAPKPEIDLDCGPECLDYLLQHSFHRTVSLNSLRKLAGTGEHGTTLLGLQKAAQAQGLKGEGMKVDLAYLRHLSEPSICWVRRSHFVAVMGARASLASPFWNLQIYDPTTAREQIIAPADFEKEWDGYVLEVRSVKGEV